MKKKKDTKVLSPNFNFYQENIILGGTVVYYLSCNSSILHLYHLIIFSKRYKKFLRIKGF